jgi:hypothetical protein
MARRLAAAALLWLVALGAAAQVSSPRTTRILFLGDGLTASADVPARLAKLAGAMGRKVEVESLIGVRYTLADHWNDPRTRAALRKRWDIVVLQQGPSSDAEERRELVRLAARFVQPVRDAGGTVALLMPWPPASRLRDFPEVIASYRLAARVAGATLIPVGEAWLRALTADHRMRLHGDGTNAAPLGSDLTVLTTYFALFPAAPQELDAAYGTRIAQALGIAPVRRDALLDAATRAIDEPMNVPVARLP